MVDLGGAGTALHVGFRREGKNVGGIEDMARLEEVGDLALKGLMHAVAVYNVAVE